MKIVIEEYIPRPGTYYATQKGCTCDAEVNRYGLGAIDKDEGVFWIEENCPLHWHSGMAKGVEV